jgi:hypothetical protein
MIHLDEDQFYSVVLQSGLLPEEKLKEIETLARSAGERMYDVITERKILEFESR